MDSISPESEEAHHAKLIELARQVGQYSLAVREGRMPIMEAAEILMRPPFNYPNIHRAMHVLNPGPPTP